MITIERIQELQSEYGLTKAQTLLNTGDLWKFEGSVGRSANDMIEAGVLMLPETRRKDYYGNTIPARTDLKDGTKGTLGNAQRFWNLVEDGDEGATEFVEQYRDFMNI
jgi:hypothetical protein